MNNSIKPNSFQAWLLAMRPKTLTGAAIPVLLGCALAYIFGKFQPVPALLCFLFAFLMQTDANFINDLYDYLKGTDREDRLGPERACAQGWITPAGMKRGIAVTTLPYPLAYHGWGDVLVLIFFGFVPVGCTFYVMAHSWNTAVFVVSLACGLIIDTLLMVNNFRDREQDAVSGKRTLVVRFGARTGLLLYFLLGMAACWLCFYFIWLGKIYAVLLPQLYLIPHILTTQKMARIGKGKALNRILGETSRNMLLFGLLLALGLIL